MLSIAICWPRKSATYGYFQDRCGNKERPAKLAKGSFYGVFSPQPGMPLVGTIRLAGHNYPTCRIVTYS